MKRFVSMAVAVLLLVTLSIPSFALTADGYREFPTEIPVFYQENGNSFIGELKTSKLSETQKDFMRYWFLEDSRNICAYFPKDNYVVFASLPDGFEKKGKIKINEDVVCLSNISNTDPFYYNCVAFDAATGEPFIFGDVGSGIKRNMTGLGSYTLGYLISGTYFSNGQVPFGNEFIIDHKGRLTFVDDDGLLEGDEPPVSSSEPAVSEPAYNFPEVKPIDSDYIAYDVTIWNKVANTIKQSVGSSINICWLILAFVMSWLLVARVVKKMSK